jgi:TnpA family transposase
MIRQSLSILILTSLASTNIAVTNCHIKLESWNSPNSPNDFIWYCKGGEIAVNNREDQEIAILTLHLLQIFMVNVNTLLVQKESNVASYN